MDILEQTKNLCKLYNIIPARSKGQNFLIKENIYDKIIEVAELTKDDVVLEVGPGLGFLTAKLAVGANGRSPVQKVTAVELDKKLVEILKTRLADEKIENIEIVNQDILKFSRFARSGEARQIRNPINELRDTSYELGDYKVVANLPYNITSIFLRKFLSAEVKPRLMVLMLQKEVAERITAKPPKMSLLAVSVQFYARPEIVEIVPRNNFWPEPEVDSAIVKITPLASRLRRCYGGQVGHLPLVRGGIYRHNSPPCQGGVPERRGGIKMSADVDKEKDFFRLVKIGFSAKRKMLKNNLAAGLRISQSEAENKLIMAGFNEKIRAQELSIEDWLKLFGEFRSNMV